MPTKTSSRRKPYTVDLPVATLRAAEYNPREITPGELDQLAASVREFGLVEPLVVNTHAGRDNVVVGGHQRLAILLRQGTAVAPCVLVDLPLERERELNARLNANGGRFDYSALANAYTREELEAWGFGTVDLKAFDAAVSDLTGDDGLMGANGFGYEERYAVIVECRDEDHQRAVYEELLAAGHTVKVVAV